MVEGLKEALQYITGLKEKSMEPKLVEIEGRTYCTDNGLTRYHRFPMASDIEVNTLTALVDYISDIVIPKYLPIFNNRTVKHIILTSGRAGTKSSYAAIRTDYQIVSDPHGSAVVLRKHHNKLRKTVYKEMIRGINRLGISKNKFTITKSPMEITYKKYGTTIYFSGSDGIDDTKGIIDEDKPIKLVVLDELTEFFDDGEGEDELSNIEATFVRGNDSDFQMIYLYNPPKNPNAPINQWCKKMEKRDDCIHIHTDYRDVPVSWLGHALIASAEAMKLVDEKMYRWVWLGQAVGVDELIYYMFGDRHRQKPDPDRRYDRIYIGGDYGQQNATTFLLNVDSVLIDINSEQQEQRQQQRLFRKIRICIV